MAEDKQPEQEPLKPGENWHVIIANVSDGREDPVLSVHRSLDEATEQLPRIVEQEAQQVKEWAGDDERLYRKYLSELFIRKWVGEEKPEIGNWVMGDYDGVVLSDRPSLHQPAKLDSTAEQSEGTKIEREMSPEYKARPEAKEGTFVIVGWASDLHSGIVHSTHPTRDDAIRSLPEALQTELNQWPELQQPFVPNLVVHEWKDSPEPHVNDPVVGGLEGVYLPDPQQHNHHLVFSEKLQKKLDSTAETKIERATTKVQQLLNRTHEHEPTKEHERTQDRDR